MPGLTIPLAERHQCQTPLKCNVALIGKATIPAMSETHVQCRVIPPQPDIVLEAYDGIFEPSVSDHLPVAAARSLSRPQHGVIVVRVINPSQDTVDLPANSYLGQFYAATGEPEDEYAIFSHSVAGINQSDVPFQPSSVLHSANLTETEYSKAEQLLTTYADIFSTSPDDIGRTNLAHHHITTTTQDPIHRRAYRTSPTMKAEIQEQVDDLLRRGIIEESFSPWSSPIVMVKKKDNTFRFCVDYRALNAVTVRDSHPIPRQDDSIDALSSSSFFSVMDLSSGYWQVPLNPDDKEKTAFTTGTGLYHFNVMPFGLVNAPMTFQRLMEAVLHGLHWSTCLVYLDDCIILGKNFDDHLQNLQDVLQRFREAGLKVKPSKCQFFQKRVTYLGYVIETEGVLPDPNNIDKVSSWPRPKNPSEVRSFIGLASFYRRFIPRFAQVSSPLTNLTQKGRQFLWTEECETAFTALKEALTSPPLLAYPDFNNKFILATDASQEAIGAILSQKQEGKERVTAYYSQKMTTSQQKWSTYDRELWAIVSAVRHFRHYLRGQEFTVLTDHQPLLSFQKVPIQDDATGRRARWIIELNAYNFDIAHRKGRSHQHADAMSRLPDISKETTERSPPSTSHTTQQPIIGSQPAQHCNMVETRSKSRQETHHLQEETWQLNEERTDQPIPDNFILANQDEDLRHHQQQDRDIARTIIYVNNGYRPTLREIRRQNPRMRRLLWQLPRLVCDKGILYRTRQDMFGETSLQVVVPQSLVPRVLHEVHGNPTSGHFGTQRTLYRAESNCYWPFMHTDIVEFCKTCITCESFRAPNPGHRAPLHNISTDHPLQMVFADIAELPTSRNGFRYILVVVDHFSKYTNIYAMKNQTAQSVAKHLFEDYVTEHGVPEILHTDQGRQFESRLIQDLCQKLNIQKSRSSPYHPQGAGIVERANRVIKEQLAKYMTDQGGDWDTHIHQVQLAYNTSTHASTGLTPYFIMHGREARIPASITCPVYTPAYDSLPEYVTNLSTRLKTAFQYVQQHTKVAQHRQKSDYDAKERTIKYTPGDLVWLDDPANRRNKLEPNWKGPYTILSASEDGLNYQVGDHNTRKTVHHNRLKLYRSRVPQEVSSPHPNLLKDTPLTPSSTMLPSSTPWSLDVQWLAPNPEPADETKPEDLEMPGNQQPDQCNQQNGLVSNSQLQRADQTGNHSSGLPLPRREPSLTDQPSWSGQASQRCEPSETSQHREPSLTDQPSWSGQASQHNEPSTTSQHQEPSLTDQPSWSGQASQHHEPSETNQHREPSLTDQPLWSGQASQHREPSTTSQHGEPSLTDQPLWSGQASQRQRGSNANNEPWPDQSPQRLTPEMQQAMADHQILDPEFKLNLRHTSMPDHSGGQTETTAGNQGTTTTSRYGRPRRPPQKYSDYQM